MRPHHTPSSFSRASWLSMSSKNSLKRAWLGKTRSNVLGVDYSTRRPLLGARTPRTGLLALLLGTRTLLGAQGIATGARTLRLASHEFASYDPVNICPNALSRIWANFVAEPTHHPASMLATKIKTRAGHVHSFHTIEISTAIWFPYEKDTRKVHMSMPWHGKSYVQLSGESLRHDGLGFWNAIVDSDTDAQRRTLMHSLGRAEKRTQGRHSSF